MHKQPLALLASAQVHVLARMEALGMGLDIHSLLVQKLPLKAWLAKLEARAFKVWARGCSPNLPAVLWRWCGRAPVCTSSCTQAAPRPGACFCARWLHHAVVYALVQVGCTLLPHKGKHTLDRNPSLLVRLLMI